MQTNTTRIITTKLGWTICLLGAAFYCYEYLLRIAPAVMVPQLQAAFQLNATSFGSLIALYYLIYTPIQTVVGLTHDLYGPKRVLTCAVFICLLGSLLFGLSHSAHIAALGRLLMGFGSAFAFVGALKLAATWLPSNRFALFAGSITALAMLGGMFGNILMSTLVATVSWQETYFWGAGIGALLMVLIWFVVKDQPNHLKSYSGKARLSYRDTFRGLRIIFKSPQMWIAGVIACALYLSLSAFAELWGNDFVEKAYGFPTLEATKINSMIFMGWLVGSPLMGLLSDKLKRRRSPLIISSFVALLVSILMLSYHHYSFYTACLLLFLLGFFCSAENICFALGRENAPRELAGTAVAFVNLVVMMGGLISQPLIGKLLDHNWSGEMLHGARVYSAQDFKMAMLILPIGVFLALIFSFFLRETKTEMVGTSLNKNNTKTVTANLANDSLQRLQWQCRRGLLELDILFNHFLMAQYPLVADKTKADFVALLQYSDQELLYWFTEQQPVPAELQGIVATVKAAKKLSLV
jgi:MFS family permease